MISRVIKGLVLLVLAAVFLVPFYLMIVLAFKPMSDLSSFWLPAATPFLGNFQDAWANANLGRSFLNNLLITGIGVAATCLIGSAAAYPLARYRTRMNKLVFYLFVACLIVPPLTILVPLYTVVVTLLGTSTWQGILFPLVAFQMPITIFLYSSFISTIPRELDEAATIDGCNRFFIFFRIIAPLMKPVMATVIIMSGRALWNDYAFSVFFLQVPSMYTLNLSLSSFFSQYSSRVSWVAAGSLIGILPMTVAYLFLQKYFIKGMTAGAVKG